MNVYELAHEGRNLQTQWPGGMALLLSDGEAFQSCPEHEEPTARYRFRLCGPSGGGSTRLEVEALR